LRLPSPSRLGLPEKFASWRNTQSAAILDLYDSPVRFDGVNAPTGSGKTALAVGLAQILPDDERILILTSTTGLEDVYRDDFAALGLRDLRGKSRYVCRAVSSGGELEGERSDTSESVVTVEHAPCFSAGVECSLKALGCTYFDAVRAVRSARIVSSNYAKWFTAADHAEEFGRFDWLICDEAADAEQHLTSTLTIELRRADVESLLRLPWPPGRDNGIGGTRIDDWRDWASRYRAQVDAAARAADGQMREIGDRGKSASREQLGRASATRRVCREIAKMRALRGDWVLDDLWLYERKVGAQLAPVWPARHAEAMLFRDIPRVVLMGATLVEKHLDNLGIAKSERRFTTYPSTFPVVRCPVVFAKLPASDGKPSMRMNMAAERDEQFQRRVTEVGDRLLDERMDRKGMALTVSYRRGRYILSHSRHRDLIITHGNDAASTRAAVRRFRESDPPRRIDSPSLGMGYDFPLDDAEWLWIPKLPFRDRSSALMRARLDIDPKYVDALCAQDLMQYSGRGMRLMIDRFQTIITDSHFSWFPWANRELFAGYWLDRIRIVNELPAPLPKLVTGSAAARGP
jgi:hypothetical protein